MGPLRLLRRHLPLKGEDSDEWRLLRSWGGFWSVGPLRVKGEDSDEWRLLRSWGGFWSVGPLRLLRRHLPLKGEDIVVLT